MIRALARADIPAAMCLKEAAGWNQTEQDWTNLLTLSPDGCFGIERDGMLVSTTTAVCYGRRLSPHERGRSYLLAGNPLHVGNPITVLPGS